MEIFENNKPIISIIKGTAISFLATIIALTVFAVLLTYTDLSENTVKPVIITITGISILIGSSIGTRKIRKNGLITGGIIGALYILIIYIISSAINTNFALSLGSAIMMGIGLIGGVLGGIIGVNTK
ncbi:MAG: TIGR04086 family membrane protein [Clostridia bacterium]|jgi:putative membrane protein (TIGR04086 family)